MCKKIQRKLTAFAKNATQTFAKSESKWFAPLLAQPITLRCGGGLRHFWHNLLVCVVEKLITLRCSAINLRERNNSFATHWRVPVARQRTASQNYFRLLVSLESNFEKRKNVMTPHGLADGKNSTDGCLAECPTLSEKLVQSSDYIFPWNLTSRSRNEK